MKRFEVVGFVAVLGAALLACKKKDSEEVPSAVVTAPPIPLPEPAASAEAPAADAPKKAPVVGRVLRAAPSASVAGSGAPAASGSPAASGTAAASGAAPASAAPAASAAPPASGAPAPAIVATGVLKNACVAACNAQEQTLAQNCAATPNPDQCKRSVAPLVDACKQRCK